MTFSEPICPALQVEHGYSRNVDCPSDSRCPVGNTLRYTCESGFTISSPSTTCQDDHTWSRTPLCIESNVTPKGYENSEMYMTYVLTCTLNERREFFTEELKINLNYFYIKYIHILSAKLVLDMLLK